MTRSPFLPITALLFAAAIAAPAVAQDTTGAMTPPVPTWASLDADGDGQLSRTEAADHAPLAAAFDRADTDADGQISATEYQAFLTPEPVTEADVKTLDDLEPEPEEERPAR